MDISNHNINDNVNLLNKKIMLAAHKADRSAEEIVIVGVSKTIENERIIKAFEAGIKDFGENKAQELCGKFDSMDIKCKWHFIGHLQINKVRNVIDKVKLIHSLDRLELADEIERRAAQIGKVVDTLIQVNVANEETKFGIKPEQTLEFINHMTRYKNIRIKGLMTVAPKTEAENEVRPVFIGLRQLFETVKTSFQGAPNISMEYLSMGMSNDYSAAIEEGANMIRVGTAIFGQRNYPVNQNRG